jgi:hypothetical protein
MQKTILLLAPWQGNSSYTGVLGSGMIQDGSCVNLGDPLSFTKVDNQNKSERTRIGERFNGSRTDW